MDQSALLQQVSLFKGMSKAMIEALLTTFEARTITVDKKVEIVEVMTKPQTMGIVLSGSVWVYRQDFWGNYSLLQKCLPTDIFAESFALANTLLHVQVRACEPSTVLLLSLERLFEYGQDPYVLQFIERLMRLTSLKNIRMVERMNHLNQRTLEEKVLSYLSAQAIQAGCDHFQIPLSRQELADYLAVDRSALSRTLSNLQRKGRLCYKRNHFKLSL